VGLTPTKPNDRASIPSRGDELRVQPCVVLGVVVAPGLARDVTPKVTAELADDLQGKYESVDWRTELRVDRLVVPPASITEILHAARQTLLERNWDLGVVVTDLPLRVRGRPVSRQVSPTHGIAIVSLPALGAIHLRHRLRSTLRELVGDLVGGGDRQGVRRPAWVLRLLWELATDTVARSGPLRFLFVPIVLLSHFRLLVGMVRANRPWRLAARLYRALVAALAAGAYGLVTTDIWRISASMGGWRLTIMCVTSIFVTIVAVIGAHRLWERAPEARVRDQVVLFNVATAATVAIGVGSLYLALFGLILAGAALFISPHLLTQTLGHSVGVGDYAALAWFIASLATVGGALGAGLESDEAVREAAYASPVSENAIDEEPPAA
jgi:hypothetical protein